ncbi:MAG: DUF547 domain-containing protein [Acidimicrobiia bacterium]|nr:DUF547 domain-containing protein [Acidimicrobiia bacterium]
MSDSPNLAIVAASMLRAQRVRRPRPHGDATVDHGDLQPVLHDLATGGISSLRENREQLEAYRDRLGDEDPDRMPAAEALSFWINLYNAGALHAAARALEDGASTVFRVPGAFTRTWAFVEGEALSLDDIEHGKVRRFGDPRIHAALVCGSISCPTLRYEPYTGKNLDTQLDDQMRTFLAMGGAQLDRVDNRISLSRIFLWYGRDFTRPDAMPAMTPASAARVRDTVAWWLPADDRDYVWDREPEVDFMPYDWGLACSVA